MEFRQSKRLIRLLLDGFWASQPCTIKYFGQTDNSFNGKNKTKKLNTCAIILIFLITGSTTSEQHNNKKWECIG